MTKFFNSVYDFFAFAFPGACIIISISLLYIGGEQYLYNYVPFRLKTNTELLLLVLVFMGYIVGYIVKPIARKYLLIRFTVFLKKCSEKKIFKKLKIKFFEKFPCINELVMDLEADDLSEKFIKIRELTPKSAQYIEFWDMHIALSHNLAFCCLCFLVVQIINFSAHFVHTFNTKYVIFALGLYFVIIIAFFILLNISLKFSKWWKNDIDAAIKYISNL